jgi:iron(III)-enterobactin esterase
MSISRLSLTGWIVLAGLGAFAAACSADALNPPGFSSGGAAVTSAGSGGGSTVAGSGSNLSGSTSSAGVSGGGMAPAAAGSGGGDSGGAAGSVSGGAGGASGGSGGSSVSVGGTSITDPGSAGDGKRVVDKPFNASADVAAHDGTPHGTKLKFVMPTGSTQHYPTANDREINVYVPMQYVKGTPAPVIVVQDGNQFFGWVDLVSNTLDNLIAAKKIVPIVAVFVNNGGGDAQGSHRGQEYDTLSGVYAEFIDQEVLPRVEQETTNKLAAQAVKFTKDPEGRGTLGGSSGGIASFIAAWYHPDLFRRVVGFSPSFVAQESPQNPEHPHGAWNFHENGHEDDGGIIAMTDPLKPIRVWLECGTNDYEAGSQNDPTTPYPYYDFAYAIPRVFLKMTTKGYPHVHLDVGTGAVHVDSGMVRATLPDAIAWTWRGYVGGI